MGVTILNALFLAECLREGAIFNSTLTLGRLDCFMSSRDLQRIARLLPNDSEFVESVQRGESPAYMDDLFRAMGASRVDAMDANDFEGATILQDLNEPLAAHLRSKYDAVVDAGTLEHVFNVPAAFKNAMDALKVGGHFFGTLPANNYCGHGFYQFSAEFFYRVFSGQNGFEMRKLFIAPAYIAGKWVDGPVFEVLDPEEVRGRVQIEGRRKMVFLVQARKMREEAVFATWPQQSDYSAAWSPRSACQHAHDDELTMLQSAVKTYRKIVNRIKGVRRLRERIKEREVWTRLCDENSALKPHKWTDHRPADSIIIRY
jgi:SAM-dependent methyltransferase